MPIAAAPARCTPCLRVFADTLFVDDGSRRGDEVRTAMLRLDFEYSGRRIRAGDPRSLLAPGTRDRDAEAQACRVLESFGVLELTQLDDCAVSPGTGVDYIVAIDGDVHALCAFGAYAVPQLKNLGWRIDIDPDYPWQTIGNDAPLYAAASPDEKRPDWFGLELGVEVDGRRIDLLPALLDMLDSAGDSDDADAPVPALRRGAGRRQALAAGAADPAAHARQGAARAVPRRQQAARAGDPRAADRRAVRDAARHRAPAALGRRHPDPRSGVRDGRWGRAGRPTPSRRPSCAPSCGRTSATAWRGCSTCASTTPAGCSPTTWGSARRCRPSRTS